MSRNAGGRRRRGGHEEHENDERWLLTYADMITLLMALFIVMWAISSVNVTKFAALRQSLHEAFSGKLTEGGNGVLKGGPQVLQPQGARISPVPEKREAPDKLSRNRFTPVSGATARETNELKRLAQQIEQYAREHGFAQEIATQIDERGLVVRLLTDKVLFDSGAAVVKPQGLPLLDRIAELISDTHITNPIRVEGNTDDRPISTYEFRSNWELSAARAAAVLQVLRGHGVRDQVLSVAGYAAERPVASNATEDGRRLNRRVEIVVLRRSAAEGVTG
jgi:chemotaxis protein MotB